MVKTPPVYNLNMKSAAAASFCAFLLVLCGGISSIAGAKDEPGPAAADGAKVQAGPAQTPAALGKNALHAVAVYLKSEDPEVRARAVEVLGLAGNAAARPVLEKMLQDPDKYVRIAAAGAVWELGSSAGLKPLYAVINEVPSAGDDPSPLAALKVISRNKIREKAMDELVSMRGAKATDTLLKLRNDEHGSIRDAAARELARLGRADELSQFTDALTSDDEAIRYESASVLGRICARGAVSPLVSLLSSEKTVRVKVAALEALGCTPGKEAASAELLKFSEDENPTIKHRAVAALGGIKKADVKARLSAIAAGTTDIRLKLAACKGLALAGEPADGATAARALGAVSPEVRLEALDFINNLSAGEAQPLLAAALEDESPQVKLAAALQIIKRFAKK